MQVDVTTDDLIDAKNFLARAGRVGVSDKSGRLVWHNWQNPIARAIARVYGDEFYASVSPSISGVPGYITISRRGGRDQRVQITGEVEVYIKEWERGAAGPKTFCIQLLSPTQI